MPDLNFKKVEILKYIEGAKREILERWLILYIKMGRKYI